MSTRASDRASAVWPSFWFWNCQQLRSAPERVGALRAALEREKPLVVVLTETHHAASDKLPQFEGYATRSYAGDILSGGIAIAVRKDIIGVSKLKFAGINIPNGAAIGGTTTQLAGLSLHIHGSARPIWLLAAYIQPHSHTGVQHEFTTQLDSLCRLADERELDAQPYVVMCGDFNLHVRDLETDLVDEKGSMRSFYDALEGVGFQCASARLAPDTPTYRHGPGVLDLWWERPPLGVLPLAQSILRRGDLITPGTGFPLISDHYLMEVKMHPDAAAMLRPAERQPARYTWRTEDADKRQHLKCQLQIARLCRELIARAPADDPTAYGTPADREDSILRRLLNFAPAESRGPDQYSERRMRQTQAAAQTLIDELWEKLSDIARSGADAAYPKVQLDTRSAHKAADQTHYIRNLGKRARQAAENAKRHPRSGAVLRDAAKAQLALRSALLDYYADYWRKVKAATEALAETDAQPKVAWRAVKKFIRPHSETISPGLNLPDGRVTTTVRESVDALSNHFEAVFKRHVEDDDERKEVTIQRSKRDADLESMRRALRYASPDHKDHLVTEDWQSNIDADRLLLPPGAAGREKLKALLESASKHTAAGPDQLRGEIIRQAAQSNSWLRCLHALINFSWVYGVLPLDWRSGNMVCLLKSGKLPEDCSSYRPITITNIVTRLVERLVKERLTPQLEPLISRWQHGFRSGRHALQAMFRLRQAIIDGTRRWGSSRAARPHKTDVQPYPVVFLDIQRAFDSAPHDYVLIKLWRHGIDGAELRWIAAFLTDRRFRICTNAVTGDWKKVEAGVPQGAVLSPLLYAVFINDCLPDTDVQIAFSDDPGHLLYADDIVIGAATTTVSGRRDQIQSRLDALDAWAVVWGVRFSTSKSGCVWFHQSTRLNRTSAGLAGLEAIAQFQLRCSAGVPGARIPNVQQYQYLGVWFHEKLRGDAQFAHVYAKCQRRSAALCGLVARHDAPGFSVMRALVQATLLPIMRYGAPFVTYTAKQLQKLDALLYAPIQRVLSVPRTTHRPSLAAVAGIPQMHWQQAYGLLQFATAELAAAAMKNDDELERMPAAYLLARKITKEAADTFEPGRRRLNDEQRRFRATTIDERSVYRRALLEFQAWGATELLPQDGARRDFNAARMREYLRSAIIAMQLVQLHAESLGKRMGLNSHNPLTALKSRSAGPAGEHTATALGLPPLAAEPNAVITVASAIKQAELLYEKRGVLITMESYTITTAPSRESERLRAQLLLNRTDLGGAPRAKNAPQTADERECRRCREAAKAAIRLQSYNRDRDSDLFMLSVLQSRAVNAARALQRRTVSHRSYHPGPVSAPNPETLIVLPSTVPGAHRGLFTMVARQRGDIIADYTGERLNRRRFFHRYPDSHGTTRPSYVLEINRDLFIDGRDARRSGIARYINHAARARTGLQRANCEFTDDGRVKVIQPIAPGEELFASYGSGYVSGHRLRPKRADPSPLAMAFALQRLASVNDPAAYTPAMLTELTRLADDANRLQQTREILEFIAALRVLRSAVRSIVTPLEDYDPPGLFDGLHVPIETVQHVLTSCPHTQAALVRLRQEPAFLQACQRVRSVAETSRPELKALIRDDGAAMLHVMMATPAVIAAIGSFQRREVGRVSNRCLIQTLCPTPEVVIEAG